MLVMSSGLSCFIKNPISKKLPHLLIHLGTTLQKYELSVVVTTLAKQPSKSVILMVVIAQYSRVQCDQMVEKVAKVFQNCAPNMKSSITKKQ